MSVTATWSVFCDACGLWVAEEPTKDRAKRVAVDAGFTRVRTEEGGPYRWLCPSSRDDVCGFYSGDEWCLMKPDHKGGHRYGR